MEQYKKEFIDYYFICCCVNINILSLLFLRYILRIPLGFQHMVLMQYI